MELRELVAQATLVGIDVVKCAWERAHPALVGPLTYPPVVQQHVSVDVQMPETMPAGGAAFLCILEARWSTTEGDVTTAVAAAGVHVRVVYAFGDPALLLTTDDTAKFAHQVALHQAWPYVRHRLQAICGELGLTPVILPLRPVHVDVDVRAEGNGSQAQ